MKCPDEMCDNNGTSVNHHQDCDAYTRTCADECPVQIQCEWCHANPESDMNLRKEAEKTAGGLC